MDEAFSNLDDLSDKETLERLESLFESSLPPVSKSSQLNICIYIFTTMTIMARHWGHCVHKTRHVKLELEWGSASSTAAASTGRFLLWWSGSSKWICKLRCSLWCWPKVCRVFIKHYQEAHHQSLHLRMHTHFNAEAVCYLSLSTTITMLLI